MQVQIDGTQPLFLKALYLEPRFRVLFSLFPWCPSEIAIRMKIADSGGSKIAANCCKSTYIVANEELLGEALAPMRDQVVIATKFGFKEGIPSNGVDGRPKRIRKPLASN